MASLLTLPVETRLSIFRYLFENANVTVSRDMSRLSPTTRTRLESGILYTCSKLHIESRPVLAACLLVEFAGTSESDLPRQVASYYYPLVEQIRVGIVPGTPFDMTVFARLRHLTIFQGQFGYPDTRWIMPPTPFNKNAMISFLQGDSDEECKAGSKGHHLDASHSAWLKSLLMDSSRSYRVIEHSSWRWGAREGSKEISGSLVNLLLFPSCGSH